MEHKSLLAIIREEFDEEIGRQDILQSSYINSQNKRQPMFELTLKQARQILMRESKFVRRSVLEWVDSLEEALNSQYPQVPTTFREALLLAAEQQAVIEEQQKQLELQAPKVEFFNAVADSKTAIPMNEASKVLAIKGYGRNNLFEFLRQKNVLMRNNQPFQKYIDCNYFRVIEQRYQVKGEEQITFKTLVYQRGIDFIRRLILKES